MPSKLRWRLDHNPFEQPLGCNGKPGRSGANRHRHIGEKPCRTCKDAENHWVREKRRGGTKKGRKVHPCGTYGAAQRHEVNKEPLDFACRVARSKYQAELRERLEREAALDVHAAGRLLAARIVTKRRRRCASAGTHTLGHCEKCGVHRAPRGWKPAATPT